VKFKLPNNDNVITCNTRVAWINEPGELKKPSLPPGMGIQFLDLSLDDMHAIRAFIEKGGLVPTW
jgi:Tfp pilus assembly protein PilZ